MSTDKTIEAELQRVLAKNNKMPPYELDPYNRRVLDELTVYVVALTRRAQREKLKELARYSARLNYVVVSHIEAELAALEPQEGEK